MKNQVLREKNVEKSLQQVRKSITSAIPRKIKIRTVLKAPWIDFASWKRLKYFERRNKINRYEHRLNAQKIAIAKNEELQEIIDQQNRFENRFKKIYLKNSKPIAFHYAEQYSQIQKEQEKCELLGKKAMEENGINKKGNEGKPHIIFIMADDLGFADIGYHSEQVFTPVLDHLADNGVKLEQYYARSVCTPSRAQFLTGRYVSRLGLEQGNIASVQDYS